MSVENQHDYGEWIQTISRQKFRFGNSLCGHEKPGPFHIMDIATGLSNICRWNGQVKFHFSVAQHSVLISHMVPKGHRLQALMHDASDAYVGDMSRPLKRDPRMKGYLEIEDQIMRGLAKRFGFAWPKSHKVDLADQQLLATEAVQVLEGGPVPGWTWDWKPYVRSDIQITPWTQQEAKERFLSRFYALQSERQFDQDLRESASLVGGLPAGPDYP